MPMPRFFWRCSLRIATCLGGVLGLPFFFVGRFTPPSWSSGPGGAALIRSRMVSTSLRQFGSARSPSHFDRSVVWISSNMTGRSQSSIIAGTSVLLRWPMVASARTQRDFTDRLDHNTTTALAPRSRSSVISS